MQAMVLREVRPVEDHPLEEADLPVPEPGPGDVLLRVQVCGVCHTDLHTVEGDLALAKRPVVPGHQIVGRVERRGQDASRFAEGARVGVAWLHLACGSSQHQRKPSNYRNATETRSRSLRVARSSVSRRTRRWSTFSTMAIASPT